MWTAIVNSITKIGMNVNANVTISNSVTGETVTMDVPSENLTPTSLQAFIADDIQQRDIRDLAFQTLTVGAITIPAKTDAQQAALAAIQAQIPAQGNELS